VTRVKICGTAREEDFALACEAGADYVGFIFAESPRRVEPEQVAAWIRARTTPRAERRPRYVGVFVNAPISDLARAARVASLEFLQLHGDEDAAYCADAARIAPVIKAVRLTSGESLSALDEYASCHAVLVEPHHPQKRGGAGVPLDLHLAMLASRRSAVFLAGGLTPDTVGAAVRAVRPAAVDVVSGVEAAPGRKDRDLVMRFVREARAAAAAASAAS
jgi:phosphoribosylanthranilate isomerase